MGNCSAGEDLGSGERFRLVGVELGLRFGAGRIGTIVDVERWGEMGNWSAGRMLVVATKSCSSG